MFRKPWLLAAFVCFAINGAASAYLHPGVGRFMQRDPVGYVDGMGVYEYVATRPLVRSDPSGNQEAPPPGAPHSADSPYSRLAIVNGAGEYVGQWDPARINCLGHACGRNDQVQIHEDPTRPGRTPPLRELVETLGFRCRQEAPGTPCNCEDGEDRMLVYIYSYARNPNRLDPWKDPWVEGPFNDYHALRGPPGKAAGAWTEVSGAWDKEIVRLGAFGATREPSPAAQPHEVRDPFNWAPVPGGIFVIAREIPADLRKHRYCCCHARAAASAPTGAKEKACTAPGSK